MPARVFYLSRKALQDRSSVSGRSFRLVLKAIPLHAALAIDELFVESLSGRSYTQSIKLCKAIARRSRHLRSRCTRNLFLINAAYLTSKACGVTAQIHLISGHESKEP